jgi:hypothetical protein
MGERDLDQQDMEKAAVLGYEVAIEVLAKGKE